MQVISQNFNITAKRKNKEGSLSFGTMPFLETGKKKKNKKTDIAEVHHIQNLKLDLREKQLLLLFHSLLRQ